MTSIDIVKVSKSFGAVEILRGIDVRIADGEFVVLVGPSGCGKSTLLRMIAGLESVTRGEIRIDDKVVNDTLPKDRDIAMVFQSYALYPHMTVAENMGFSLMLKKAGKAETAAKVQRAADILGLGGLLDRYPRQLSGGQRQRVAMGRAIVRDPKVFLFDEPLSNLDAKLRVTMRSEIRALQQKLNTTTIYVTHDQFEAMTMADKIVVMREGRVEQTGEPLEVYDMPQNIFVAGFIGSPAMNLIPGVLGNGQFLSDDGTQLPLPDGMAPGLERRVIYGIRPEHVDLDPGGVEAITITVEPTGAESIVVARMGDATLTGVLKSRIRAHPGDMLRLLPRPQNVHLFDEESGQRIGPDLPDRNAAA